MKAEEACIDQMVTDGKLAADQAAQYETWLESKPNIPSLNQDGGFGFDRCGPAGRGGPGRGMMASSWPLERSLKMLVLLARGHHIAT